MNTDVPFGRMKLILLGSTPSAIQATLTPAPVMPSERAVRADGLLDAVFVVCSASRSSSTWPLAPQAPGMTFAGSDVLMLGAAAPAAVAARAGRGRRINTSGTTLS